MKKKIIISLLAFILVIGLGIGGYLYLNRDNTKEFTYIILKINPELMLSLDKDNKVIEVKALNDEAKIFVNRNLIGLSLEKAINIIIDVAVDNGYLEDGIISLIGMSNFKGFSVEQAERFINNKGIVAKDTNDLLDFGIDCEHTESHDTLVICNAYAVTASQRAKDQKEKYDKYQKCLQDFANGLNNGECGTNPNGAVIIPTVLTCSEMKEQFINDKKNGIIREDFDIDKSIDDARNMGQCKD